MAKEDASKRCISLAIEGERFCRNNQPLAGIKYLESALAAGTDDLRTLSAIYSQLGNAYFYLEDYLKALEYHRHDLTLARVIGDKLGEAKASGNLGNTLKVLGKYEEAILCCNRHLDISKELSDKIGEARAYYSLGNVFHARGKYIGRFGLSEPGDISQEVRQALLKAVQYYKLNLELVQESNDKAAQGRSYGNLGNTYYLLGDFLNAVHYHKQRLKVAEEFGDKPAMRRAFSNLGNAHVFLGEFEHAVGFYKDALKIAVEIKDQATEAQACYSIANTYSLLQEHNEAMDYYLRHLSIARKLEDSVGQARAAWSLGNAFTSTGDHAKALYFMNLYLLLSRKIGDSSGESAALQAISDLKRLIGPSTDMDSSADPNPRLANVAPSSFTNFGSTAEPSTHEQELACNSITWGATPYRSMSAKTERDHCLNRNTPEEVYDSESFLDLLEKSQSKRMDDQRCDLKTLCENKENQLRAADDLRLNSTRHHCPEDFLDLIVGIQSKRMNDQRAELSLPGLQNPEKVLSSHIDKLLPTGQSKQLEEHVMLDKESARFRNVPNEDFFEMLMRCQSTRLEEQRSELPKVRQSVTVPDDDLFLVLNNSRQAQGPSSDQQSLSSRSEKKSSANAQSVPSALDKILGFSSDKSHRRTASQKIKKTDKQ